MFDGIILAGGGNTRIGYNKALLLIDGATIIERIISAIEPMVETIIIVLKKQDFGSAKFLENYEGIKIVLDDPQFKNPLIGIYTGLIHSNSDYSLILPCDMPFASPRVLKYLLDTCHGFDLTIPRWSNGYLEPLCAVYRKNSILPLISNLKDVGSHPIRHVITRLSKVRYVPVDDLRRFDEDLLTFYNINTFQEYEEALKISRGLRKNLLLK
ncbi:MAG: molybdenum cofactor guanylyltransferase [Candidatus Bathyarchaeia archaeon]